MGIKRKLHWTQKPENKRKLRAALQRAMVTKSQNRLLATDEEFDDEPKRPRRKYTRSKASEAIGDAVASPLHKRLSFDGRQSFNEVMLQIFIRSSNSKILAVDSGKRVAIIEIPLDAIREQ